ncbi:MAG: hypothetical protein ACR2QW_12805 [bacterium]
MRKYALNACVQGFVLFMVTVLSACTHNATIKLTETSTNPTHTGSAMGKIAVFALYGNDEFELRALVENTITKQMQQEGIDVTPGYRFSDSYQDLENRLEELDNWLVNNDIDGILFVDPVRAKAFDPREHAERRSAYRALGLSSAALVNLISSSAQESDASKYVMDITLWDRRSMDYTWYGIYDIKANHGYDPEWIKKHLSDFSQAIVGELKQQGLVLTSKP